MEAFDPSLKLQEFLWLKNSFYIYGDIQYDSKNRYRVDVSNVFNYKYIFNKILNREDGTIKFLVDKIFNSSLQNHPTELLFNTNFSFIKYRSILKLDLVTYLVNIGSIIALLVWIFDIEYQLISI